MSSPPLCGSCPAFLHDPESIPAGRCFGCRSGPPQMRMSEPPQLAAKPSRIAELEAENARMRKALERIAKWHGEFPATGRTWNDGEEMSYSAAYGSNGERDYMRSIAQAALEAANGT